MSRARGSSIRGTLTRKLGRDGKPVPHRFVLHPTVPTYTPRILRGSIVQPIELTRMAKARAKRDRRAAKLAKKAKRARRAPKRPTFTTLRTDDRHSNP